MRRRGAVLGFALAALAAGSLNAVAEAPKRSPWPEQRPSMPAEMWPESDVEVTRSVAVTDFLVVAKVPRAQPDLPDLRPAVRPISDQLIAIAARVPGAPVFSPELSIRPEFRPDSVVQQALFGKRKKRKGSVCGNIDIQGEKVGSYGKGGGCFIPDAVRVRSVSGVQLSTSALMTCDTAEALNTWVDRGLQPYFGKKVVELKVAAHYACRTRNNRAGAKLSEHAKGRAIDISAITLQNGKQVTILNDWNRGTHGKALVKSHAAACGSFGTVLGPRSDGYHRDHFHFDTANYRSGAYCR